MKAILAQGEGQVVFHSDRGIPKPGPGEVLVKVVASPIQPSDRLNVSGSFPSTRFPIVPGRDYAGIVVEPASSSWHGRSVYGTSGSDLSITRDGAHAEFVVVPEDALAIAPQNMDLVQAGLVGTPWTTAWLTLHRAQAKKDGTVLVINAGGNVGADRWSSEKYDVDVSQYPDLSTAKDKTNSRGPDVVIDATGDLNLAYAGLPVLNKRGRLAIISTNTTGSSGNTEVEVDFKELYRLEHGIVGCNSFEHSMQETAGWLTQMAQGFETGELSAPKADGPRIDRIEPGRCRRRV